MLEVRSMLNFPNACVMTSSLNWNKIRANPLENEIQCGSILIEFCKRELPEACFQLSFKTLKTRMNHQPNVYNIPRTSPKANVIPKSSTIGKLKGTLIRNSILSVLETASRLSTLIFGIYWMRVHILEETNPDRQIPWAHERYRFIFYLK